MLLENRTDENIYCMIQGRDEKIFVQARGIIELESSGNFIFKLFHTISSDYHLEKFTKCPKCTIRVNSSYSICNVDTSSRIVIEKCERNLDYIFSYVSHYCSIDIGEITSIEYNIIDSELLIESHKKHLKKGMIDDFILLPLVCIDVGLGIFVWKWCGFAEAMFVLFPGLIVCFFVNAIISLLFSRLDKDNEEYLKYFTTDFTKMILSEFR